MQSLQSKQTLTLLKWISGGVEAFLGIPILGGIIIISTAWAPLGLMFLFHMAIIVLAILAKDRLPVGNVIGVAASVLGFIPFVGMTLHIVAGITILLSAYRSQTELSLASLSVDEDDDDFL